MREQIEAKLQELLVFRVRVQENYEAVFDAYKMERTVLDGVIATLESLLKEDDQKKAPEVVL